MSERFRDRNPGYDRGPGDRTHGRPRGRGYDDGGGRGYDRRDRGRPPGRGAPRRGPNPAVENPNFEANWTEMVDNFDHMGLREQLLHGVYSYGFKQPSEIQALAVRPIKQGRSVIAQAQSGTGKTGAFTIGILDNLDLSSVTTQAVVLAPTRELAEQIYRFFIAIGQRLGDLRIGFFIGGLPSDESKRQASSYPHVAVGTPGRVLNLIQSGHLRCENIRMICLDEADQMLSQGFIEQIQEVFSFLHEGIQILLFSATIPEDVFNIMEQFMRDPIKILVKAEKLTLEGIRQFYVNVGDADAKFETLIDIYGHIQIQQAIIFANSKTTVDYLQRGFEEKRFPVSAIHGGLDQSERNEIMMKFRTGVARVLVSTDLLARGIDVQQVTLVINFELPSEQEQYLHRIGRSGRYGRKGVAINICSRDEVDVIKQIREFYRTAIDELPFDFATIVQQANDSSEEKRPEQPDV